MNVKWARIAHNRLGKPSGPKDSAVYKIFVPGQMDTSHPEKPIHVVKYRIGHKAPPDGKVIALSPAALHGLWELTSTRG